jgi:hypothetical protein
MPGCRTGRVARTAVRSRRRSGWNDGSNGCGATASWDRLGSRSSSRCTPQRCIARRIPGGEALADQAASAFTDAFQLVAWISVGIALAAAVILFVWRRRREPATEDIEQEVAEVDVDLARLPVRPCP